MTAHFESWTARARVVPIEREIDRRGIKLRGAVERVGPCPKCGGEDRFAINTNKGVWNCRGCGVGGDVIELVRAPRRRRLQRSLHDADRRAAAEGQWLGPRLRAEEDRGGGISLSG